MELSGGRQRGFLILALSVGVLGVVTWLSLGQGEELDELRIAAIESTCLIPQQPDGEMLVQSPPPTALDGPEFVQGLEPLPILAAILSERSTAYEEAQVTSADQLIGQVKQYAQTATDRALEVLDCYERELGRVSAWRTATAAVGDELKRNRDELLALDVATYAPSSGTAHAVIELGPKETKQVRLRTLCIDRFAPPPVAGTTYILGGTVDELRKPTLCQLLQSAQAGGVLASTQNAVWKLEQDRMDPATPPVAPQAGTESVLNASQEHRLAVTATATGTLTALDVTFVNLTDAVLAIDTTCAYFVPLSIPDLTGPIPPPAPDWSDPNTIEQFTEDIERQTLQNLGMQEESFRKLGIPFPQELKDEQERLRAKYGDSNLSTPQVKGVYSQVFLPGAESVDPDTLDPFQPIQTGVGLQPLGIVGATDQPGVGRYPGQPRLRDVLRRDPRLQARERLEQALDDYARDPSRDTVERVFDELNRCFVNDCAPSQEWIQIWEQIRARADLLVDQAVDRVIASVTAETLQAAIDTLRFCQSVGCHVEQDAARLDQHFRSILRERAARGVSPSADE